MSKATPGYKQLTQKIINSLRSHFLFWQKCRQSDLGIDNTITQEQLRLIRNLSSKFQIFLGGGFADEVLLNGGKISRTHGDVDLWAKREEQENIVRFLKQEGYKVEFLGKNTAGPAKISADKRGVYADVPFLDWDSTKNQAYVDPQGLLGAEKGFYFESRALNEPMKILMDIPVRTLSPLSLVQLRREFIKRKIGDPKRKLKEEEMVNKIVGKYSLPNVLR